MTNQMELAVEERLLSGKKVRYLRRQGIVPAVLYGKNQPSVSLQVNAKVLQKLLDRGGSNVVLSLKMGDRPGVQSLIKEVEHDAISLEITHLNLYRIAATEMLRTSVRLHFVNDAAVANLAGVTILRSLSEVMVECLPSDLPTSIEVDLSQLDAVGAVIRVGNLKVGPGVTILNGANDMVVGVHQARAAAAAEEEEKPSVSESKPSA